MSGDPPPPRAPASPETLQAAQITPGQRRTDDAIDTGLRPNLGASLYRDAAAREGATLATRRAARAADIDEEPPYAEVPDTASDAEETPAAPSSETPPTPKE